MATGQPYTRMIMTWGWGRLENDQSSAEIHLLLFRKHFKEIIISLDSLYARDLGGTSEEDVKSLKEDYEIRKSVKSDPILSSFYALVILYVFLSRSNKCTSKLT